MREAGVPLEVIQRRLGYSSIRTTADILPEPVDRGVADKPDDLFAAARGADVVQPGSGDRVPGSERQ